MYPQLAGAATPLSIEKRRLANNMSIPCIGFGTFSARLSASQMAQAVHIALSYGYLFYDCAEAYRNQEQIGEVFADAIVKGLDRSELYVLSKLHNSSHGYKNVGIACRKTLKDLRLDYLDAYLTHWPVSNNLSPNALSGIYDRTSRPYIHSEHMETWRGMESLVQEGLVRSIGVSNMTLKKLHSLLQDATVAPVINEMEIHPTFQQPELFFFNIRNGILPVAYSPLGAPARPNRNVFPGDLVDTKDPTIVSIAQAHGVSPASVCIKWAIQRGQVPVPFSSNPANILSNLMTAKSRNLNDEEMSAIEEADQNCRLSRGHGYLWPGAKAYHELWDEAAPVNCTASAGKDD